MDDYYSSFRTRLVEHAIFIAALSMCRKIIIDTHVSCRPLLLVIVTIQLVFHVFQIFFESLKCTPESDNPLPVLNLVAMAFGTYITATFYNVLVSTKDPKYLFMVFVGLYSCISHLVNIRLVSRTVVYKGIEVPIVSRRSAAMIAQAFKETMSNMVLRPI